MTQEPPIDLSNLRVTRTDDQLNIALLLEGDFFDLSMHFMQVAAREALLAKVQQRDAVQAQLQPGETVALELVPIDWQQEQSTSPLTALKSTCRVPARLQGVITRSPEPESVQAASLEAESELHDVLVKRDGASHLHIRFKLTGTWATLSSDFNLEHSGSFDLLAKLTAAVREQLQLTADTEVVVNYVDVDDIKPVLLQRNGYLTLQANTTGFLQ